MGDSGAAFFRSGGWGVLEPPVLLPLAVPPARKKANHWQDPQKFPGNRNKEMRYG